MERGMKVCPLVRDIIGRVVSPRCGSSYADGSQRTEKLPEQRSAEQGHEFPQDIIDKGNGTHFRVACLRDEDARQGIVTESGTDG